MRSVALAVVLLSTLALAGPAAAPTEELPSLVVLDLEPKGAAPLQAEAATLAVIRGLRALDVFQVVGSNDMRTLLTIDRQRQLLGAAEGTTALTDLNRSIGTQHVVAGTVTSMGGGLSAEIKLLDTSTGRVVAQKALGPLSRAEELAAKLPGLAQELVGPLLLAQQGSLSVRCSEEAAEILVDDVVVASTPQTKPVALPRGTHRLQVRRDGFIAQSRSVVIWPQKTTYEDVTLMPSPDYAEAFKQRHGRLRVGAVLTTGLAVAALAGAVVVDRALTEPTYRQQFLPRQLALNGTLLGDMSPSQSADPEFVSTYQACGLQPGACSVEADQLQQQLQTQQVVTGVLAGVGIASGATALYLWLTGEDPNRYARLVASLGTDGSAFFAVLGRF